MTHTESKECLYCKETFFPSRKDAKFCSSRCKHRHFLEKEEKNGSGTVSENVSEILQLEANRFQNVSGNQKTDAGNASETVKKRFPPGQFLPAIIEKKYSGANRKKEDMEEEPEEEDTYYIDGRQVSKERFYGLPEKNAKPQYNYWEKGKVEKANLIIYKWVKRFIQLAQKPLIVKKQLKEFIAEIEEYIDSYEYRALPNNYEFKDFLEKELLKRLKLAVVSMEIDGIKYAKPEADPSAIEKLREVAFSLKNLK